MPTTQAAGPERNLTQEAYWFLSQLMQKVFAEQGVGKSETTPLTCSTTLLPQCLQIIWELHGTTQPQTCCPV